MKPLKILLIAVFLLTCGCAIFQTDPMDDPYYQRYILVGQQWLAQNPGKTWDDFAAAVRAEQDTRMGGNPEGFLAFMNSFNQLRMLQEMQFQNQFLMIGPRPIRPYGFGW